MSSRIASLLLIAIGLSSSPARADEPGPLKVLWCTGGGFHDFKGLTPLLCQSIQRRANVRFDVSDDYKSWARPGFADGHDAVVYFFSHHDKEARPVVEGLAATIHAGK